MSSLQIGQGWVPETQEQAVILFFIYGFIWTDLFLSFSHISPGSAVTNDITFPLPEDVVKVLPHEDILMGLCGSPDKELAQEIDEGYNSGFCRSGGSIPSSKSN